MKTYKEKKAIAHIEIIISFVIFISFITFMLIIFKPLKIVSVDTASLDVAESKIIHHISGDLTLSSLILNSSFASAEGSCLYVYFSLPNKVIIKDENMNIINSNKSGNNLYLKYSIGKRFYRIYSSEELEEKNFNTTGCYKLNESNYTIGITRNYKKIAYSKIAEMDNNYSDNYESLKKALNLINDFTFIVRDDSGVIFEGKKSKPKGINILAKDISIEILDKNASLKPAILNLQVWE